MGGSIDSFDLMGYKASSANGSRKDSSTRRIFRLGPKELEVIRRIIELGLVIFRPTDLGLPWDKRRINDVLKRLVMKGLIEKVQRGLYKVVDRLRLIQLIIDKAKHKLTQRSRKNETRKDSHETRSACASHGYDIQYNMPKVRINVDGPFLDNLDAYTVSGRRVRGDRVDREFKQLVFFTKINYAEVLYKAEGAEMFGVLVIYKKDGKVRVEWRPPKGYVKRNGLESALRMYWEMVLEAFRTLLHMILQKGPFDVKLRMVRSIINAGLKQLICV